MCKGKGSPRAAVGFRSSCRIRRTAPGFTLLELLLAITILTMIVLLSSNLIEATRSLWEKTSAQIEQFRVGRQVFETVTRRVSQAVLNPYWAVKYDTANLPQRYERASELRFLVEPASALPGAAPGTGTALFFQAPTGYNSLGSDDLSESLNTWGYFIEYGPDTAYRPDFLSGAGVPTRYRFRLIELLDPSDNLVLFSKTSGFPDYAGQDWFQTPLAKAARKRELASNVIALVVLPKLSSVEDSTGTELALKFTYDSTVRKSDPKTNPRNQLPPAIEVAMVVISEKSANRVNWGPTPPSFIPTDLFTDASQIDQDLETLRAALADKGLKARVLRATIPIVAARWSTEQSN